MDGASAISLVLLFGLQAEGMPFAGDRPGKAANGSVRFLVLADWGGKPHPPYRTRVQVDVAREMSVTAERENASFVISLGDNIYENGVRGVSDFRFQTTFEQVYNQESLNIPWYIIAGNHDHYGNVMSQIYRSNFSTRWTFPDFYYKVSRTLPGGKVLEILLLDTTQLCGESHGTSRGKIVRGPKNKYVAEKQWRWIERKLKNSKADYLLVGGHHPVYSAGQNGPTECLYKRLEPLFYEYHVTAYLSGHDHDLQHIQNQKSEQYMDYFISGRGAWAEREQTNFGAVPDNSLKFFFNVNGIGGFALFDASDTNLKMQFIDSNGVVRYSYEMQPRN